MKRVERELKICPNFLFVDHVIKFWDLKFLFYRHSAYNSRLDGQNEKQKNKKKKRRKERKKMKKKEVNPEGVKS